MSELTLCNFCSYRHMVANAQKQGQSVELRGADDGWIGAVIKNVDGTVQPGHAALFLALTDHCVC